MTRPHTAPPTSIDRFPALRSITGDERQRAVPAPPHVVVAASARVLFVRVACVRAAGAWLPEPVSLAVGERGRDPDVVFPADRTITVIETQLCLIRTSAGGFAVDGRYLVGGHNAPALELRWGITSPRGHFLLMSGLHLRLPEFRVRADGPRSWSGTPVLTATATVTDPDGIPRCGVVGADDLAWQLSYPEPAVPSGAVSRPRVGSA